MVKKKISKKYNTPINIYKNGEWLNTSSKAWQGAITPNNIMGTVGSTVGSVGSIIGTGVSNSQIADTSNIEGDIEDASSYVVGANDNDSLMNEWGAWSPMDNVSWRDIRGGSTGQRLTNTLGAVGSGVSTGAQIGGPIGGIVGGVVGLCSSIAGWLSGNKKAKRKAAELNKQITMVNNRALASLENRAEALDAQNDLLAMANYSAKGGKIYIKPENRGKFTEYCGGKVTSECIAKGKRSSNPTIRKRATFADNARKWKHEFGGHLFDDGGLMHQHGGIFSNGVIQINSGGLHSTNPNEGVQIGVDYQGIPNLLEEGEVIWNDYVFSNRLKPTKEFKNKYKVKGETFADVAKNIQKESEERPNDPISKRGLNESMLKLQIEQEDIRMKNNRKANKNIFAGGGPAGIDPSLFEEEGNVVVNTKPEDTSVNYDDNISKTSWLRYAPVAGSALGVLENLFSKPDYRNANIIADAANKAGQYTPVRYTPVGNYLSYNPLDRNFYINKLNAQAGATRRAIVNQSAGNRATATAGLLAADYNSQSKLGDLARQAEEYNLAQRQAVEQFNRSTNMANAEMALQSSLANSRMSQAAKEARLRGIAQAVALRDEQDKQRAIARSSNLTTLFDNLGNIAIDKMNREDAKWIASKMANYSLEDLIRMGYTDSEAREIKGIKSKGGKLNCKKGLTY